jgi:hypothetical protein
MFVYMYVCVWSQLLGRQKQEDCELEASQGKVSVKFYLKKKTKKKQKKTATMAEVVECEVLNSIPGTKRKSMVAHTCNPSTQAAEEEGSR